MPEDYRKYLNPAVISKLSSLELKAKYVVEGFISGLHKSPFHGFSVEFAEHRQYMPGDDLKYLDWKVLGRTDRYYIKQFEEETNLKSYLVVDASKSMAFSSSNQSANVLSPLKKIFKKKESLRGVKRRSKPKDGNETTSPDYSDSKLIIPKLEYATYLAASLSVLMFFQKDAFGLVTYAEKINSYIPPRATSINLKQILLSLNSLKASGKTQTASVLNSVAERIKRRGLVIIFSDLFDEPKTVINSLRHFRHKRNEVIVFQILDPLEMNFAIDSPTIFKDMETEQEMMSQPLSIMQSYKEAVQSFIDNYKTACHANGIDHVLLSTETPFDSALIQYLTKRKKLL